MADELVLNSEVHLAIRSEEKVTPIALDVLKEAKRRVLGDHPLKLHFLEDDEETDHPTLVLGKGKGDVNTLTVRQLMGKETAVSDLTRALRLALDIPEEPLFDYRVIEQLEELDELGPVVMFDIETAGDISTMRPSETRLISMAFNDGERILVVPEELCESLPEEIVYALRTRTVVAHNGKFDLAVVSARLGAGKVLYPDHDTMLMHFDMNHGAKVHGLEPLAIKWFNAEPWEHHAKKYTVGGAYYENIPRDILYKYNAEDVYWTGRLYREFYALLEADPPRRSLYGRLMRISNMLQDVERGGVTVDVPFYERLSKVLGEQADELLADLRELVADPKFNPGSHVQVKRHLGGWLGAEPASSDEPTLNDLRYDMEDDDEAARFIDMLLEYRGLAKLRSTYAEGILKRQHSGVIFPSYLIHGTTTGRLSSKDPNIQNMPRPEEDQDMPVRKGLVPSGPDRTILSVDYSQAELRVLAEITQDENMIAVFQPGAGDYFDMMMPQAFPTLFKDLADFEQYKKDHADDAKNKRATIKGVQYGLNYGRGVPAIAKALRLPVEEAAALVGGIFDTYPGLKKWHDNLRAALTDPSLAHFLTTPFNRQFQFEVITRRNHGNAFRAALAFVPQSTANDICLNAALEVHARAPRYDARIVGLVHDAIYLDAPDDEAVLEPLGKMVMTEMTGAAARLFSRVPFETEATTGPSWADG